MGAYVSGPDLVQAVRGAGEKLGVDTLGVLSGTGLPSVLVKKLQDNDPDFTRAIKAFPVPEIAQQILSRYKPRTPKMIERRLYKLAPEPAILFGNNEEEKDWYKQLVMVASFTGVYLSLEGHSDKIGINLLEKIQDAHPEEIYGAMLAAAVREKEDARAESRPEKNRLVLIMGAGIPDQIPDLLDKLVKSEPASYRVALESSAGSRDKSTDEKINDQAGDPSEEERKEDKLPNFVDVPFDPGKYIPPEIRGGLKLMRPEFYPIVANSILAEHLMRKTGGRIDGFIGEKYTAGGHNAKARSKKFTGDGEPLYTEKDDPTEERNMKKILALGVPYYPAGGKADKLEDILAQGGAGIQAGSIFALSDESEYSGKYKLEVLKKIRDGNLEVKADPDISPSGYTFEVVQMEGTMSDLNLRNEQERKCWYGYLAERYRKEDGSIGSRCPAEPVEDYVEKGGDIENTLNKACLCSILLAAVGMSRYPEDIPVYTLGKEVDAIKELIEKTSVNGEVVVYKAEDAVRYIASKKFSG